LRRRRNGRWREAIDELARVLRSVREEPLRALEAEILSSKRIFVTGLGRTGLMARGFAMRLMHLGRRVYHVGDVITPAIRDDDLLVICSRTGRSKVLGYYVDIARKAKARVAVVTAVATSAVARRADVVLAIDDRPAVAAHARRGARPAAPLGSLYEQALLVVLDQVVVDLMGALGMTEADLARIHTTFE
jgi:6-phospho-3-hexuloisomerase